MTLRPEATKHKALISTTSRLVGEYEREGVLIAHAWPDFQDSSARTRHTEGPASRSAFMFAFETQSVEEKPGIVIQNYTPIADIVCSYLSVLFGKRFDNHGLVEGSGYFNVPDMTTFNTLCEHQLPQNSHSPRADFPIPLNLVEVSRFDPLFHAENLDHKFLRTFQGAGKFYLQALQNIEHDPEVAYLHLITAGEILSNYQDYDKDKLIDDQTRDMLSAITDGLVNGEKIARSLSGRLLLIKKRFTETILGLTDDSFFETSESTNRNEGLKKDSFQEKIAAAYDLRGRYVHTGVPFGIWISLRAGGTNPEVQLGMPVVEDKEFGKILAKAPTYVGLERTIRHCLIRFAQLNGAYIEPVEKND